MHWHSGLPHRDQHRQPRNLHLRVQPHETRKRLVRVVAPDISGVHDDQQIHREWFGSDLRIPVGMQPGPALRHVCYDRAELASSKGIDSAGEYRSAPVVC